MSTSRAAKDSTVLEVPMLLRKDSEEGSASSIVDLGASKSSCRFLEQLMVCMGALKPSEKVFEMLLSTSPGVSADNSTAVYINVSYLKDFASRHATRVPMPRSFVGTAVAQACC